jgi:hypothetical protein
LPDGKTIRLVIFHINKFLTFTSNLLTNLNMTDVEMGYKAFRDEIIRNMVIASTGFGFEIEVTAKIAKLGCAIYEVPISYYGRTYEQGKKIGLSDGIAAIWFIFRFNLLWSEPLSATCLKFAARSTRHHFSPPIIKAGARSL